jgi:hypothetical protein
VSEWGWLGGAGVEVRALRDRSMPPATEGWGGHRLTSAATGAGVFWEGWPPIDIGGYGGRDCLGSGATDLRRRLRGQGCFGGVATD